MTTTAATTTTTTTTTTTPSCFSSDAGKHEHVAVADAPVPFLRYRFSNAVLTVTAVPSLEESGLDLGDCRAATLDCAVETVRHLLLWDPSCCCPSDNHSPAALTRLAVCADEWETLDDHPEVLETLLDLVGTRLQALTFHNTYDRVQLSAPLPFSTLIQHCLVKCPRLHTVTIRGHGLDEADGRLLGELVWLAQIRTLDMRACQMSSAAFFRQLRQVLELYPSQQQQQQLEELCTGFHFVRPTDAAATMHEFWHLCRVCGTSLKRLLLRPDRRHLAGRRQLALLTETLTFLPRLESLNMKGLKFWGASVTEVEAFFRQLARLPYLRELNLSDVCLDGAALAPLIDFVNSSATLRQLVLNENGFLLQSAEDWQLQQALATALGKAPALREVTLPLIQDNTFLVTLFRCLIQSNSSLESLTMDYTSTMLMVPFLSIDNSWVQYIPHLGPRFSQLSLPVDGNPLCGWDLLLSALKQNVFLTRGAPVLTSLLQDDAMVEQVAVLFQRNRFIQQICNCGPLQGVTPAQWSVVLEGIANKTNHEAPLYLFVQCNVGGILHSCRLQS